MTSGRVYAREAIDERLHRRAARLRLLDQVADPGQARVTPDARDEQVEGAAAVDGAGVYRVAERLVDRAATPLSAAPR